MVEPHPWHINRPLMVRDLWRSGNTLITTSKFSMRLNILILRKFSPMKCYFVLNCQTNFFPYHWGRKKFCGIASSKMFTSEHFCNIFGTKKLRFSQEKKEFFSKKQKDSFILIQNTEEGGLCPPGPRYPTTLICCYFWNILTCNC